MKPKFYKSLDVLVWTLMTIGALNWGFIGLFNIDIVAAIFGSMTFLSRLIYALVGFSAVYEILGVKLIAHRWNLHFRTPKTA